MNKTITVIKGDGIGPEIVTQALRVLDTTSPIRKLTQVAAPSINTAPPCPKKA